MIVSIEIAHRGKNGRHPHINILACSDEDIPVRPAPKAHNTINNELLKEWKALTDGTSFIHNIRKINVKEGQFSRSGIGEVFKYAIKFSDLNIAQLAEVMNVQNNHRYRFFASYGILRGMSKLPVRKNT